LAQSYRYIVKDRQGKSYKGIINAESKGAAASVLTEQGYYITELEQVKSLTDYIEISAGKAGNADLSIYCRNLSAMLAAGLSITQTLRILAKQAPNRILRNTTQKMIADLEGGLPLSSSMRKYKNVFPDIAVTMVEAGELAGVLEQTFDNLSIYFKKENELREKVISAIIYPSIVTGFALIVLGVLLNFVLPNFANMFKSAGVQLPALTRFFLDLSAFVKTNILTILVVILALFVILRIAFRTGPGKKVRDWFLIKLPVIGKFNSKVAISRFCRTLSLLIQTGVPILQALGIVNRVSGNVIISENIIRAGQAMEKGESMSTPLAESSIFTPMVTQMISIGEETGTLDVMLGKISDIYDEEIERTVKRLTSILEPVIIILLSVIVGIILLSVVIPMFDIITKVPG